MSALGPSQARVDVIGFLLEVTFMLMTSVHSSPVPIQLLLGTLTYVGFTRHIYVYLFLMMSLLMAPFISCCFFVTQGFGLNKMLLAPGSNKS